MLCVVQDLSYPLSKLRPNHFSSFIYDRGTGGAASVPVGKPWLPGGGGRNIGRYVTTSDISAMPTEK